MVSYLVVPTEVVYINAYMVNFCRTKLWTMYPISSVLKAMTPKKNFLVFHANQSRHDLDAVFLATHTCTHKKLTEYKITQNHQMFLGMFD